MHTQHYKTRKNTWRANSKYQKRNREPRPKTHHRPTNTRPEIYPDRGDRPPLGGACRTNLVWGNAIRQIETKQGEIRTAGTGDVTPDAKASETRNNANIPGSQRPPHIKKQTYKEAGIPGNQEIYQEAIARKRKHPPLIPHHEADTL